MIDRWIQLMINSSLQDRTFLGLLSRLSLVCSLLKGKTKTKPTWSHLTGQFPSSFSSSCNREGNRKGGCLTVSEGPKWKWLSGPLPVRIQALWGRDSMISDAISGKRGMGEVQLSLLSLASQPPSFRVAIGFGAGQHSLALVQFLSPRLAPICVDREWEIQPAAALLWCATWLNIPSTPFNIYLKPLGEIICHRGLKYLQYADDIQFHISTPGDPRVLLLPSHGAWKMWGPGWGTRGFGWILARSSGLGCTELQDPEL